MAYYHFPLCVESVHHKNKNKHAIVKIPDKLWDEVSTILPKEKPINAVGRPIVPYRKEWTVLFMFSEPDASGKCYLKNTVLAQLATDVFNNGSTLTYSKRCGLGCCNHMITNKVSSGHGNRLTAYP